MATKKRMPVNPLDSVADESKNSEGIEDIVCPDEAAIEPDVLAADEKINCEEGLESCCSEKDNEKSRKAKKLILRNTAINAVTGFIPVPYLDTAAAAAVQLDMLGELSKIYGVPFKKELGKKVLASLIGAAIPALSAKPLSSALSFIPVIGSLKGILLLSNAAMTYAIGMVFKKHYQSGGTLLTLDIKKMKTDLKGYYKKGLQAT